MSSAKTVGSALATSRTALEDIVRSIAAELRPWKCSERDVLAKVRKTIDEFREDSDHPPTVLGQTASNHGRKHRYVIPHGRASLPSVASSTA